MKHTTTQTRLARGWLFLSFPFFRLSLVLLCFFFLPDSVIYFFSRNFNWNIYCRLFFSCFCWILFFLLVVLHPANPSNPLISPIKPIKPSKEQRKNGWPACCWEETTFTWTIQVIGQNHKTTTKSFSSSSCKPNNNKQQQATTNPKIPTLSTSKCSNTGQHASHETHQQGLFSKWSSKGNQSQPSKWPSETAPSLGERRRCAMWWWSTNQSVVNIQPSFHTTTTPLLLISVQVGSPFVHPSFSVQLFCWDVKCEFLDVVGKGSAWNESEWKWDQTS